MVRKIKVIAELVGMTYREWREQKPELIGAAIAFYIIFSLGPILVIIVEAAGLIFGKAVAEGQIVHEFKTMVGENFAEVIQAIIVNAETPPAQTITMIISIPMILFGSTMIFFQLKNALNYIWGYKSISGSFGKLARNYISSFVMVLFLGGLLLTLILKSFVLTLLAVFLKRIIPFPMLLLSILDWFVTFAVITFLFAMIYKILTEPEIRWSDEWIGAAVTSLLLMVSQYFIGVYFRKIDIGSALGAIGSFTLLLIWVYYSSLVFLLGAVFTKVYAREYGSLHEHFDGQ